MKKTDRFILSLAISGSVLLALAGCKPADSSSLPSSLRPLVHLRLPPRWWLVPSPRM